jgi:hypothetical protein
MKTYATLFKTVSKNVQLIMVFIITFISYGKILKCNEYNKQRIGSYPFEPF